MSYVQSTLLPNEKLVLNAQIHWIVFTRCLGWFILALIVYFKLDQGMVGGLSQSVQIYQQFNGEAAMVHTVDETYFFISLGLILIAVISAINALIYYLTTEFAITDKRVIVKIGWIKRDTWELNVNRVTSLNVDQSVMGRFLDYGDIRVVGMGGSSAPIRSVVNPLQFRRIILTEVEGAKF
jgi:hypothetical protein